MKPFEKLMSAVSSDSNSGLLDFIKNIREAEIKINEDVEKEKIRIQEEEAERIRLETQKRMLKIEEEKLEQMRELKNTLFDGYIERLRSSRESLDIDDLYVLHQSLIEINNNRKNLRLNTTEKDYYIENPLETLKDCL